nr:MAK10-like protein [Tanacetum cinerariifolium]
PSHEGYRNTIDLLEGNNVVPLQSVTIRLMQNGCSFHGLWSEDPNQYLKDFLKLVDSLNLDGKDRKTPQRYPDVPTTSWRISIRSMDSFQGLTPKSPSPQPQALNTTFEARVQDYMVAHTKRMERSENTIFKQHDEINGRMTKMFGLLKKLMTSRHPEKVLTREEAKFPVTKNLNYVSLTKEKEGGSDRTMMTPGNAENPTETKTETPVMEVEEINEVKSEAKIIKTFENDEAIEALGS